MRVRTAELADVSRLVALLRANATAAQWTDMQLARMFDDGEGQRVILVVEAEAGTRHIGSAVENDNRIGEESESRCHEEENRESARDSEAMRVEGFAVANRNGLECEIENVVVNPEQQRRGLGKTLLKELLNRLRRNACEAVFLEVRESNRAARGLYTKCGFQEVGRRVKYYAQPQEDAVLYRFCFEPIASEMVQT